MFESLFNDVESKVFARFGDETVVYPGHGDDTTLGAERPHLETSGAHGVGDSRTGWPPRCQATSRCGTGTSR